mmetsp:Transcript_22959/g.39380  ORF Transcript_22959/g.39380 Transcript_22959/m.39380 type:complete len:372 (-) Transcript_22959:111-1226(-)
MSSLQVEVKSHLSPADAGIRVVPDRGTVCPTAWTECEYDQGRRSWRMPSQHTNPPLTALQLVMCGAFAGTIAKPVVSPLDVVRTRSQVLGVHSHYNNLFGAIQRIYREEGPKALFKGNGAACLRLAPYSGTKFMAYEYYKSMLADDNGKVSNAGRFIAGGAAGISAVLTTYPLEVVKVRLTLQNSATRPSSVCYNGIGDCVCKIVRHEGFRGLFGGIFPTLVGEVVYEGAVFVAYEQLKDSWSKHLRDSGKQRELTAVDHLFLGSIAGGCAQLAAYPLDVVRKRMMMASKAGTPAASPVYTSTWHCLSSMIRQEGWLSLYRGTGACLLKIVPYAAVMFAAYEQAKGCFAAYNAYARDASFVPAMSSMNAHQ